MRSWEPSSEPESFQGGGPDFVDVETVQTVVGDPAGERFGAFLIDISSVTTEISM